jgi:hypothetical protein
MAISMKESSMMIKFMVLVNIIGRMEIGIKVSLGKERRRDQEN